jgi:hypothetical protein
MFGLSLHFLKQFIHILANPLAHVFSLSLQNGYVPAQLKIAQVIPIFKSGDPQLIDNYRPISLLNNFSKILEKVVSLRLTNFLETNNLFSNFHFGFPQGPHNSTPPDPLCQQNH